MAASKELEQAKDFLKREEQGLQADLKKQVSLKKEVDKWDAAVVSGEEAKVKLKKSQASLKDIEATIKGRDADIKKAKDRIRQLAG